MKVTIVDFINWMHTVHNYGVSETTEGQSWDDGVTEFILDNFEEGDVLKRQHPHDVSIETPVCFHNWKKNKNKKQFEIGYKIANIEKQCLDSLSRKEFKRAINEELNKIKGKNSKENML